MMYPSYDEDLKIVKEELQKEGTKVEFCSFYPANNCVGIGYGRVSMYYTVRDGKVVEKMVD